MSMSQSGSIAGGPTVTAAPDRAAIAQYLAELDPALLLAVLVHLTGDRSKLDEYAGALHPVEIRTARVAHDVDPERAQALRQELAQVIGDGVSGDPALGVPDLSVFKQMAEMVVGEDVPDEFLRVLREQAGFVGNERYVEPIVAPPAGFDVVVIGAGLVGIDAAVKLHEAGFNFTVFEERDEVGGTWSRNRYPGVAVDTPSHYYSLSFELNSDWTHYYPFGAQYLRYLKSVTDKYDVIDKVQLSTKVLSMDWHEDRAKWVLRTVRDGQEQTVEASAVITALGFFGTPIKPQITDADKFKGVVMHSSEWDSSVDLNGKKVTVVGAGCTAVQIVASLVDQVAELTTISRQPHWIIPEQVGQEVSPAMQWAFTNLPFFNQWFRLRTYWYGSDKGYEVSRIDPEWAKDHLSVSPANDVILQVCQAYLDATFADDPELKAKLTPDFPPFAKRVVKDPGYYAALKRDHVQLLTGSIERFTENGYVATDGTVVEADVVVMATGFKLDWLSTIEITGKDGQTLAEKWDPIPRAYLGVTVPGFPNLFITSGPNAAILHGGGNNFAGECQVHYIVECLQTMLNRDVKTFEVTQETVDEYNVWVDAEMDRTVWQHGGTAHGYYREHGGKSIVGSPWRMVDYWNELREPRLEKFLLDGKALEAETV
jgi:4-hydroxyacetophenone monooxygenase